MKKGKGPFGSKKPGYYFPGRPNAFVRIPNRGKLHFKSFTIFAWIKQNGVRDGPIVEYRGHKSRAAGTHFWTWKRTLYANIMHNNGKHYTVYFPKFKGMFPRNKWAFVGVSYNHKNGHVVMWINGRTYFKQAPRFAPDTVGDVYVGIRPSKPKYTPFKGYISGVSILPYAIPRNKVTKFNLYFIKLIGKFHHFSQVHTKYILRVLHLILSNDLVSKYNLTRFLGHNQDMTIFPEKVSLRNTVK
jgi:hypothetical protein